MSTYLLLCHVVSDFSCLKSTHRRTGWDSNG